MKVRCLALGSARAHLKDAFDHLLKDDLNPDLFDLISAANKRTQHGILVTVLGTLAGSFASPGCSPTRDSSNSKAAVGCCLRLQAHR